MGSKHKDDVPMLSDMHPYSMDENADSRFQEFSSRNRNVSSIPVNSVESSETEHNLVGYTGPLRTERRTPLIQMSGPLFINRKAEHPFGPNHFSTKIMKPKAERFPSFSGLEVNDNPVSKNEHLLKSGPLGKCDNPYCTTCPSIYSTQADGPKHSRALRIFDPKLQTVIYGDAKGCARRIISFLNQHIPIMNPHAKAVQQWNKFFVISCLLAIFIDPLFFFLLSAQQENKCIVISWPMSTTLVVFRSMTDLVYLLNIFLQFRLAYIAPESTVMGAGELVDHPTKIAWHYFRGYFWVDILVVLPLPQVVILVVLRKHLGSSGANHAKNLLRAAVLVQYVPRLYRFLPVLVGQSPSGFIFETAWANFFINLLTFVLSGHVVGSCWYLFGLQRVNQCLRDACDNSTVGHICKNFIDCGHGFNVTADDSNAQRKAWRQNATASACFTTNSFSYGIYNQAVGLTSEPFLTRYIYSLFWGFQQISTLAGNQQPSYFIWEVLFTMGVIGLGLLLFAFLIGNMQNFLQALGRRRMEMSLRRRDVEQWMSLRRLPPVIRRKVIEAERYTWAATRGVNEEQLLENLPEDLRREIKRHLFKFVKKVWIFALMGDQVVDAICERIRPVRYIEGGEILYDGGPVEKMVFIVRGKLQSIDHDGTVYPLLEGSCCGEELLTWCLEKYPASRGSRKIESSRYRLLSSRTVRCLTNIEAFSLRADDLEEVTSLFARNLREPHIQGAIRYQSPHWRTIAATRIQIAWRYRKNRQKWVNSRRSSRCSD
ncbi:hypothetical protein K2173_027074 [Erythroxylum novogranatense]|uniref:Cyclic nucleotide-binding domain-containing protein n=1 Tax=Erythroxylum novogranatense TaxID=1862640 RepID=A0AAV8TY10_9ROSI|nr:hypothetical protein K2173_027074 [Erythroxylum novogranatense]